MEKLSKTLEQLKNKYNYNDKTISALAKILPSLINYYGEEYEHLVLTALLNTEIISCSSKQTISKVIKERTLTNFTGSPLEEIDLNRQESVYFPNIKIIYDDETNSYKIDKIDRVIVTSHTFNYDSPKGLEVLTHALCHLVKSFKDEFIIEENTITIRSGISYEKRKIMYGEEITLDLIENFGKSLEEGFNILDTEFIVSMVLHDNYKCYDYDSIYMIAYILKKKYELLDEINSYEICGDINNFKKIYNKTAIEKLSSICDECVSIENNMHLSYTREEKDVVANILKEKLEKEAFTELISIYKSSKSIIKI